MRTPKSKLESGLVSLALVPLQYKTDKTGLGGLSTSIWSWGAKAAAAATELSKDVAAKVGCYGPYLPATVSRKRRLLSSKLYRVWRPGGHGWNNEGHGQVSLRTCAPKVRICQVVCAHARECVHAPALAHANNAGQRPWAHTLRSY
jgi:hypothetical protein